MNVVIKSGPATVTIDPDRGAEIVSYLDQRLGGELLWSTNRGNPEPSFSSEIGHNTQAFYDDYRGGIQELFPNTANATTVRGAELPFHGELCRTRMACIEQTGSSVTMTATLRRYPVRVTRNIALETSGRLIISSEVVNLSSRDLPYSWGLHPVFSELLTGSGSLLWCRSNRALSHPTPFANVQQHPPGAEVKLERGVLGDFVRLAPGDSGSADLVYIELEENWFQLGSPDRMNVRLEWSNDNFNQLWLWQECEGQDDWPWWGQHHIVGVEPHTSAPAAALADHIASNRHQVLPANATAAVDFIFDVTPGHEMKGREST